MNRKYNKILACLSIFILFFGSCRPEDEPIPKKLNVDSDFLKYFESFFSELEKRNVVIDSEQSDFFVRYDDSIALENNILGMCPDIGGHDIIISRSNWEKLDDNQREFLMYHELGHCALGRHHNALIFATTNVVSWMNPWITGDGGGLDLYSSLWRAYYLDELFHPELLPPQWILNGQGYSLNNFSIDTLLRTIDTSLLYNPSNNKNFQINFKLDSITDIVLQFGNHEFTYTHYKTINGIQQLNRVDIFYEGKQILWNEGISHAHYQDLPITFSIRKVDGIIFFLVNNWIYHCREYKQMADVAIQIKNASNYFDEIEVLEWDD